MMQKREHLLYYMMKGHVHLSKKDYGFFNNLTYIIKDKKQVTSNQNKLFDKLILKYQRQLRKLGHDIEKLNDLTWDVPIVDSSNEYLTPKLYLQNDEICLRTPFNTNFVRTFRDHRDNTFIWNKEERIYRSKFYTHSLRLAYDSCKHFFKRLDISADIKKLIGDLIEEKDCTNVPILTVREGKYYINNINQNLYHAIKDIELNDDPSTLHRLTRHGISIDKEIIKDDPIKVFASQYITKLDIDEFLSNDYLGKLNIKNAILPTIQNYSHLNLIDKAIKDHLIRHSINIITAVDATDDTVLIKRIASPERNLAFGIDPRKISKLIQIVNSRPVEIR